MLLLMHIVFGDLKLFLSVWDSVRIGSTANVPICCICGFSDKALARHIGFRMGQVGSSGKTCIKSESWQSPSERKPKIEDMKAKKEEPANRSTGPITPSKSNIDRVRTSQPAGSPGSAIPIKPKRVTRPKKEYNVPGQKKDTPAEVHALNFDPNVCPVQAAICIQCWI